MSLSAPLPTEPSPSREERQERLAKALRPVATQTLVAENVTCTPPQSGTAGPDTDYIVMAIVCAILVYLWMQ